MMFIVGRTLSYGFQSVNRQCAQPQSPISKAILLNYEQRRLRLKPGRRCGKQNRPVGLLFWRARRDPVADLLKLGQVELAEVPGALFLNQQAGRRIARDNNRAGAAAFHG